MYKIHFLSADVQNWFHWLHCMFSDSLQRCGSIESFVKELDYIVCAFCFWFTEKNQLKRNHLFMNQTTLLALFVFNSFKKNQLIRVMCLWTSGTLVALYTFDSLEKNRIKRGHLFMMSQTKLFKLFVFEKNWLVRIICLWIRLHWMCWRIFACGQQRKRNRKTIF